MSKRLTLWESLDTEWIVLLIISQIILTGIVLWALVYFFKKFKEKNEAHKKEIQSWKED